MHSPATCKVSLLPGDVGVSFRRCISSEDAIKQRKANAISKFMYLLILFCVRNHILISVENPASAIFGAYWSGLPGMTA